MSRDITIYNNDTLFGIIYYKVLNKYSNWYNKLVTNCAYMGDDIYNIKIDISKFDSKLQYSEIKWFTLDEIQDLPLFEGEDGIKEGFRIIVEK